MSKALRIPGPGRTRRPGLALAVLTVASVAVLVAAEIWLHTGWTGIGLTLRSQLCNGTPLEGFTLSGSLGWTVTQNRIHFTLQDGVLHTELRLDDPDAVHDIPGVVPTRSYALSPETRDQADANAVVNRPGIEGNRQANTTVNTVRRMYTIWLPDDTELRVDAGDVSLSEGVTLTVNAPKLSVKVCTEPLEKLLLHLLKNAAAYTPAEGKIWLDYKKRGAHTQQFIVTDTGCGIPEDRRENLFKPFSEVRDLTQGDGLGLPICSLMATRMNGSLSIDTAYTKGTRFVLELHV